MLVARPLTLPPSPSLICTAVGKKNVRLFDVDFPERLGDNLFIQEITEVVSDDGKFSLDKLKINLWHIVDLKDHKVYSLTIVCEGSCLLFELPSVPDFFHSKHKKLAKAIGNGCKRTEFVTAKQMTAIESDPSRLVRKVLVVLPEGMVVTNDFSKDPMNPTQDIKVGYARHEVSDVDKIGSKRRDKQQLFNPAYWSVRIVPTEDNKLDHSDDSGSEDSFAARFAGKLSLGSGDDADGDTTLGDASDDEGK